MICKKCGRDATEKGYQRIVERRLVPGLQTILCLDCVALFDVEALESAQYQSLCVAEAKAETVIRSGDDGLSCEYATKAALDAKRCMMDWTLAWLGDTETKEVA